MGKKKKSKRNPSSVKRYSDRNTDPDHVMSEDEIEKQLASLRSGMDTIPEESSSLASPIGYVRKHGGLPATKQSLGQNWLLDPEVVYQIAELLDIKEGDPVLEVGPGGGALTEELFKRKANVTAVEIDRRMVDYLEERWPDQEGFTLHHADILQTDYLDLMKETPFTLVGNLPYNITSSLLFKTMDHAVEHPGTLKQIVVMLQKEVAERITAEPGNSNYSILSVFTRLWGVPEIVLNVPRESFKPMPNVDSAVLKLDIASTPKYPLAHWPTFKRLVKGAFSKRRKMLRNSIGGVAQIGAWQEVDFDWNRRPQTLSAEEFAWLTEQLVLPRFRNV